MRIAQIAPLSESVPPRAYGGTERVVSYLTEELVQQGHDVTLFASGDSQTQARLVPVCPQSLRLHANHPDELAYRCVLIEQVAQRALEFDILHFHIDCLHLPLCRRLAVPSVTTLHGRLDLPELQPFYREFHDSALVSVSNAQRAPLPHANFCATVYHGMPLNPQYYRKEPSDYFAFVGRVSPEKRLDRAIEIAKRSGVPLKIVAKVDRFDQPYFKREIEPLLNHPLISFLGERGEDEKRTLLARARALLFPIDWPEPFGLAMIEAMSSGTPVIAFRHGSIPEVIENGVTGIVVDDIEGAVAAAKCVTQLDRPLCRAAFERRFSATRMANDYLDVYATLIEQSRREARPRSIRAGMA